MSALASVDTMFPEIIPPGERFRQLNINIYMVCSMVSFFTLIFYSDTIDQIIQT